MIKIDKFIFPQITQVKSLIITSLLILTTLLAARLTPTTHTTEVTPELDTIIPMQFGEWKKVVDPFTQVGLTTGKNDLVNQLYDKVVMRTYENKSGDKVMLAIAYAHEQKQDIKIHRPEVCYVAQGFQLLNKVPNTINIGASKLIKGQRLLVKNQNRYEAISYWIRIGDDYPTGGMSARLKILKDGLKGKILDGVLVRVSTIISDPITAPDAYKRQEAFIVEFVNTTKSSIPNVLAVNQ